MNDTSKAGPYINDVTLPDEEQIMIQSPMDKEPKPLNPSPKSARDLAIHLVEIDAKIKHLYDLKKDICKELIGGNPSFTYIANVGGDKPWLRVVATDNLNIFNEEDTVNRNATFRRYEVKIDHLKNEPKA